MDRRQFILAFSAGAALLGAAPARAECGEMGASEFVETTYQQQARLHASNVAPERDEFFATFSRHLRKLMRPPRRGDRNLPLGPVLNVFFGRGVPPHTEITVGKVKLVSGQDDGPATISVELGYKGETHTVLVHALRQQDRWRIANVIYDSGKSLLDHYRDTTWR